MKKHILFAVLFLAAIPLVTQGCASLERGNAVPAYLQKKAHIPGMEGIRYRAGEMDAFGKDAVESYWKEKAYWERSGNKGPLPPANFLAISGGGDSGAFGAGLLVGWTAAGTRPEFKAVTGISTGALIAPFAFLGPKYDDQLKAVYTAVTPKDILKKRSPFKILFSDSAADSSPLFGLVSKYVNQDMMNAIAKEHEKGRILLIGTTDLDARRGVIWNITKMAATKNPKALELVRKILLASASIPGAFPPVMIDLEAEGRPYQEMHVDGGTTAQVFIYPPSLDFNKLKQQGAVRERHLYVIRNSRLDPEWAEIERKLFPIVGRAISTLIQNQGKGDLFLIYNLCQRDDIDFNLAYIPRQFKALHREDFDQEFMNQLFDFAYKLSSEGYHWDKIPPGYIPSTRDN